MTIQYPKRMDSSIVHPWRVVNGYTAELVWPSTGTTSDPDGAHLQHYVVCAVAAPTGFTTGSLAFDVRNDEDGEWFRAVDSIGVEIAVPLQAGRVAMLDAALFWPATWIRAISSVPQTAGTKVLLWLRPITENLPQR